MFGKRSLFYILDLLGMGLIGRNRLSANAKVAVLNLHRVSPEPSPYWPPLQPSLFESLLRFLDQNFEVRSLADMNLPQGRRPVAVLSFDDGYYDFIEYALPLINKYKMPVNMNVIPTCAETGIPIWNVRLYDFLAASPASVLNQVKIPGCDAKLKDESEVSKLQFGIMVSRYLKNRPRRERVKLFQPIEKLIESVDVRSTRMMTTEEIRGLAKEVEFGAHSYSHESMGHESDKFFADDVSACRRYFDTKLGSPLQTYAFPNGSYRTSQIEHLRQRKIERILLVDEKPAGLDSDVIPRITMYGDSAAELRLRAVGFMFSR